MYWGPDCQKGDIDCLKKQLFIPDCSKEKNEIRCYKKWLGYPDCEPENGKCWKDWNDQKNVFEGALYWSVSYGLN